MQLQTFVWKFCKMRIKTNRIYFTCSLGLLLGLAAMVLLIPLKLLAAVLISAVLHELFHMAALFLLGIRVFGIKVGVHGAKIETQCMSDWQELICALAGPLGGFALLGLAKWFPALSICAAFHSLYNLLPIYPADGGRVLRCGARLIFSPTVAEAVYRIVSAAVLCAILAVGCFATIGLRLGPVPLFFAAAMVIADRTQK